MRGDWIHDWVQVEMAYRAGSASRPREHRRREAPARSWAAALRSALFPAPKEVRTLPVPRSE